MLPEAPMNANEVAAFDRLIAIAQTNTGQARRVAAFLLAWWDSGTCGGFDLTDLWGVDPIIVHDMQTLFGCIARVHRYPDTLGFGDHFEVILRQWRQKRIGDDRS
ncbi:hypothetical protein AF72_10185 [Xylella taiwanensis]|uniref:DUF7673 domain-containing protein n=1 Tax=Xylella taiwanensis TaxID=1444770 RepID=Z9JIB2_9GAMM|nr:hypothetical protein AF72_10185 [Xylella taiwanensis]